MSANQFMYARALEARGGGDETKAEAIEKMDLVAKAMADQHKMLADLCLSLQVEGQDDGSIINTLTGEHGKGYSGVKPGTYAIPSAYAATLGFFKPGSAELSKILDRDYFNVIVRAEFGTDKQEYLHVSLIDPVKVDFGGYRFQKSNRGVRPEQVILGLVATHPGVIRISDEVVAKTTRVVSESMREAIMARVSR